MIRKSLLVSLFVVGLVASSCAGPIVDVFVDQTNEPRRLQDTTTIPTLVSRSPASFILVRHADKSAQGSDPVLSAQGIARAQELARLLSGVNVAKIYSTPFNRTRQTAQPIAAAHGLQVAEYSPNEPIEQLADRLATEGQGKVTIVVGHSNTIPALAKALVPPAEVPTITETDYDNLFVITMDELQGFYRFEYGAPTQ
jgi:2,3-bisphosphoglycerate-dependent phosphoglycerate mutase